jgi:tetratricopeptide (TPR) repeat protein
LDAAPAAAPELALVRGQLALRDGDVARALNEFDFALNSEPTSLEAVSNKAMALRRAGRTDEAIAMENRASSLRALSDLLQKARGGETRDDDLPRELALLCESLGCLEQAKGWCLVALGVDAVDPAMQALAHRLDRRLAGNRTDSSAGTTGASSR